MERMTPARCPRPSKDEYFMSIAYLASERSTCLRRKVGAVLVKDGRILATGYNGAPSGVGHCASGGCLRTDLEIPSGQRHELCMGLHAEQNAIIQAAREGKRILGSMLYITNRPCSVCSKMIVNAGIREVVFSEGYPDVLGDFVLREAGIDLRQFQHRVLSP